MRVHTEVRLSLAVLLAVQLATTLAAVGLFGRMAPAIERILADNEYSVQAAEEMLAVMARCPHGSPCGEKAAFTQGLQRVRQNITEAPERPLIAELERDGPLALAGDRPARVRVVQALHRLSDINRDSMASADAEAKRLGVAGGWTAVLLGVLAFALTLVFGRRLHRRVVAPLGDLAHVAGAASGGDLKRRARLVAPAGELEVVGRGLNDLLDRVAVHRAQRVDRSAPELDRAVLLHLLDRRQEPVLVYDRHARQVLAANGLGTERLVSVEGSARDQLLGQVNEAQVGGYVRDVDVLPGDRLVVCELAARGAGDPADSVVSGS